MAVGAEARGLSPYYMAFFQKPAVGLDVSDRSIEAVLLSSARGKKRVISYGRTVLPPGLVEDGVVLRKDELAAVVRKLLADQMTPPLPKGMTRVAVSIPESQVFSHVFSVPRLADEDQLRESLALEADGIFPYGHADLASGITVIARRPDKKEVYYAAVRQSVLDGFLSLLSAAGLTPAAVEAEPTSIARAVLKGNEADPVVFVDIGARVTHVVIFDRNGIQFSESLETAGDAFTNAVASATGLSAHEAEEAKRREGLLAGPDGKGGRAISEQVDRLVADLREAVRYYERRSGRSVHDVRLCGGSSAMPGLLERVAERLPFEDHAFEVRPADPWQGVEVDPALEKLGLRAKGPLLATALGLALLGAGERKFPDIDFLESRRHRGTAQKGVSMKSWFRRKEREAAAGGNVPPKPSRLPHGLKLGLGVAAALAVAGVAWILAFRVAPMFFRKPAVTVAKDKSLSIEIPVEMGAIHDPLRAAVNAVPIDVEETFQRDVARSGTKKDGLAKGRVTLSNASGRAQTLVERTRLLAADGTLFRLDARVTVPSGKTIEASVTADLPGAAGDVPPGRFTIPGLSAALQKQVLGESSAAFTGGVVYEGEPLTAEELAKERQALIESVADRLYEKALSASGSAFLVRRELFGVLTTETVEAPEVGKPVGDYALTIKARARAIVMNRDEMDAVIRHVISEKLDGADAAAYAYEEPEIVVQALELETGTAKILVRTTARP